MRSSILTCGCVAIFAAGAWLASGGQGTTAKVRVRLVDAASGDKMTGIIRVAPKDGAKALCLPGLLDRFRGLTMPDAVGGWHVLPRDGADVELPLGDYRLEALAGVETSVARLDLNVRKNAPAEVVVKLHHVFRPEEKGLVAGNTHLHLMKLSKDDAEDYLRQIPAADQLRVMFISYLERKPDDKDYITNSYPIGDLPQFNATGVLFNNGEEHRHNFQGYGQGYGHVMFLNIKELVKPVSVGPGIMQAGFDDTPLQPGIENARKQGGTVIWCHNTNGHEDVLNALAGQLDALNFFDGSRTGKYEDNYYRYLNVGVRLPISTGTDWFMYDFSRVYADMSASKEQPKLTIASWLEAVKAGRCQATNGPLLSLRVDDAGIGGTIKLAGPKVLRVEGTGIGRHDFQKLELVHNGKVIKSQASTRVAGAESKKTGKPEHFHAILRHEVRVDGPGWFALRVNSSEKNECDKVVYAHTSPIYVQLPGKQLFLVDDALDLLKQIEEGAGAIRAQGKFSTPAASAQLVALYDRAAKELRERINQARK